MHGFFLALGVAVGTAATPPAAGPERWGSVVVAPGQKATGHLPVPAGADGETALPITVVRGTAPGPRVGIVAGVHGAEYVPIVALQRLAPSLRPEDVAGTVVLVHLANPPSFYRRTVYYGPADWKNLNRVFPGRADGTLTERIAHVLTRDVIDRVEAFIDVHCGDANEALDPYVSFMADGPDPAVTARARALALAFGIPTVKANRDPQRDWSAPLYSTGAAAARGRPAIGVEMGGLGQVHEAEVENVVDGLRRALQHLGVLSGAPAPVPRHRFVVRSQTVRSAATGLFTPEVDAGQQVAQGQRLGVVRDAFGTVLEEPRAPLAGRVLYVTRTPPLSAGEPVASIGELADSDGLDPRAAAAR
jgi:predicted deacylase